MFCIFHVFKVIPISKLYSSIFSLNALYIYLLAALDGCGLNPSPWQWKQQVLTTGLPGNSHSLKVLMGFPRGSAGKEYACHAGDLGSIPGLGRSPGEGKGYLLQYSGLENSVDCIVHGFAKKHDWVTFTCNYWILQTQIMQLKNWI